MAGYMQHVVASAARTELAILRTAPVLLESLTLLQSLVQARNSFSTACSAGSPNLSCKSVNTASSASSSSNRVLTQQPNSSSTTGTHNGTACSCSQHRCASSSSTTNFSADVVYASDGVNSTEATGTSSSSASPDDQHTRQGAYRRGFGAKVALPSADVLHEVLMGQEATIKMRAYHIGARLHIGQVAQRAKLEGCRINSGKDYCIIWLNPSKHKFQSSSSSGTSSGELSNSSMSSTVWAISAMDPALYERLQSLRKQLLSRAFPPIMSKMHDRQERLRRHVPPRSDAAVGRSRLNLLGPVNEIISSASHIEPLLVVYRYGSVVFAGTRPEDEPGLVDEYVPSVVRYKAGGDSTWAQPNPMLQSRSPVEEHTVQVVPSQAEHAKKGTDQVLLRVLDIGGVRVLTSVLAQSAALKFYETSVAEALDKLAQYRARVRAAQADRTGWYGSAAASVASMSGEQERTFFKVIAASALVMNEARELLEMAEPAWQYAAYHSIWALTADDFELERRFKGLELKLRQVEKEAKHDVKDKAGRRYHRLEQSVVWLLVVSCLLAALEVSKKAIANSSSSKSDRGMHHQRADLDDDSSGIAEVTDTAAGAAGVSEDLGAGGLNGELQDTQSAAEQQYDNVAAETAGISCDHDATAAAAAADNGVADSYQTEMVMTGGAAKRDTVKQSSRRRLWWRWRRNEDA